MRSSCCLCLCSYQYLNTWTKLYKTYHDTWVHLSTVLFISLPSVYVSVCVSLQSLLGNGSVKMLQRQWILKVTIIIWRIVFCTIHVGWKESMRLDLRRTFCLTMKSFIMWSVQSVTSRIQMRCFTSSASSVYVGIYIVLWSGNTGWIVWSQLLFVLTTWRYAQVPENQQPSELGSGEQCCDIFPLCSRRCLQLRCTSRVTTRKPCSGAPRVWVHVSQLLFHSAGRWHFSRSLIISCYWSNFAYSILLQLQQWFSNFVPLSPPGKRKYSQPPPVSFYHNRSHGMFDVLFSLFCVFLHTI
jgi:hypothetical protein